MTKLMVAAGVLVCLGIVSQGVERSIDKEEVKHFVTEHFEEQDEGEDWIDFQTDDKKQETFIERIGF
ncbi:hypothetical protein BCR25_18150 [Enterococcus termitis]|uniref:Uncharacterized protein n=1 Tax=Enterococcus termitis TaxID=332950 RepID=A0A1E5GYH7_9ENTE|nr:hypothetical protein BCR25_18150 [Enterococcus termitis]